MHKNSITKGRKGENTKQETYLFRVFPLSCFRDSLLLCKAGSGPEPRHRSYHRRSSAGERSPTVAGRMRVLRDHPSPPTANLAPTVGTDASPCPPATYFFSAKRQRQVM